MTNMAEAYSKHTTSKLPEDDKWGAEYRPCHSCRLCVELDEDMSDTKCGHQQLKKRLNKDGNDN